MTARLARAVVAAALALLAPAAAALAAGPPFPPPVDGQAVYDTAGVLRPDTIRRVEGTIDSIEARTGAEVVIYTQLTGDGISADGAEQDAIALMDQWGVGRAGFDDGLVILFDLHRSDPCHGQVQLYGGPGYRAVYLSNDDRQRLYEQDMLPLLRRCDLDGALLVAMTAVDARATTELATRLDAFRIANAALGVIVAPLLAVAIVGWGLLRWYRTGRDPVYLDDPSIHLPAPPRGLTPAAGAALREGHVSRRALTAASLDLAVRGRIRFEAQQKPGLLASGQELGIIVGDVASGDPVEQARMTRARTRAMDGATDFLLRRLRGLGGSEGYVGPAELLSLGEQVSAFGRQLEEHLARAGWFVEPPSRVVGRWAIRGGLGVVAGIVVAIAGASLPASGLVAVGVSLALSGGALLVIARAMPSVTRDGAMVRAMLEAYRRTLQKTMAGARSMDGVPAQAAIPLVESPDDAVAWGVALGLQDEVEEVLERTADDARAGRGYGYVPRWYGSPAAWGGGGRSAGGGVAPGLMSSSPIPNFGGMMAALGTIGNSPASSGDGGGFAGGSSGGGGGGAGGGF